ncbi:2-keto-4-pentenoate hydratase/2-oxohepta-3-ene-1,7-dioic acid hydratase in catechol pathway [Paraburkholderia bannensis]|uniref:2-keto-4-pentenoate hydratase/2-oxohepta-3-ene-1,7-dioic acid hydratase in catechol pathway n=1 Tax=Paraburkholderia bannensis TaxID=765414 RepID=A0A7W9WUW2_9BURK|nr:MULTISPECIES: fumarylacetoacetate hydrolase family protein [Paraburkholderia]MBB3260262.1 2-keto-4-pentenoate hydratase/2-oxohepta-3-ene-1,7-dioic acid hydratase in catechol pathway [Paraburkholderia sp. WP4_3_2]MBB6105074.1 2-keto-4-pentenoate hydratase/2-oxohepta-3-ene-1,7-dioic acid hydratase in catechol pathway [Paraburkholderia bannensis]
MDTWMRLMANDGSIVFGRTENGYLHEYEGIDHPVPTGAVLSLRALTPLAPCAPGKVVALWNNFHALASKLEKPVPEHPLFLLKPAESVIGSGETIRRPAHYAGKIVFEGELGIVIGKRCRNASLEEAQAAIFGYTVVNDVTAAGLLSENPHFPQWCRAKGFDTFCCLGPAIVSGFDWRQARVVTLLDGVERQNYALDDMVFAPAQQVSLISQDLTLEPGDVIACGTSLGVGSIGEGAMVSVTIEGIGTLVNTLRSQQAVEQTQVEDERVA